MSESEITDLLSQAERLAWADPSALRLGEQAIRLADQLQAPPLQFQARAETIAFATSCGNIDKALVACAWCISQAELLDELTHWPRHTFLWNMKMVWGHMFEVPHISLAQIEEISSQMSQLHRKYGYNQRPTEYMRYSNLYECGHLDEAREAYSRFLEIPRDSMADCEACETNTRVRFLARTRHDKEALAVAAPIIAGDLTCVEVPHSTYCRLLQPLIRLGEQELAEQYHKTGYAKIRSNRFLLSEAATHIGFDVHTDSYARAISRFERQLPIAIEATRSNERYEFYTVAGWLMERLAERGRPRKIKLPNTFPPHNESDRYDCGQLRDWFEAESSQLADAFDARNGNDYYRNALRKELRFESV